MLPGRSGIMKKHYQLIVTIVFLLPLVLSGQQPESSNDTLKPQLSEGTWVDSVLTSLTLEEKIAQLLMIRTYSNKNEAYYKKIESQVKKYNLGGLCFFQGGPHTQAQLTNRYQKQAKTPLFIAMDAEWGLGMRLDSAHSYPFQMTLGSCQQDTLIYGMGVQIAKQLKALGVHINFAPVVDVNNNPQNPVINSRSFGETPSDVATRSLAYMQGLQDEGIIATAKHFPGHGDTDSDSHYTLPVIKHSRERLDSLELAPFKSLFNKGLQAVMVAHLYIPALDSTKGTPTTLSPEVVNGLLKEKMGFKGLVITDALDMKGVTSHYKPGEIESKAFVAGNDILLLPQDIEAAIDGIKKSIKNGSITTEEVTSRCRKVLRFKYRAGLYDYQPASIEDVSAIINSYKDEILDRAFYQQSIITLKNERTLLPVRRLDTLNLASLSLGSAELTSFQLMLENYTSVRHFNVVKDISVSKRENLINQLKKHNLVIAGIHGTTIYPWKQFGIRPSSLKLLDDLADSTNVVLVLFASPYSLEMIDNPEKYQAILLAHQDVPESNEIAAQMIMGGMDCRGKLPVNVLPDFPIHSGLTLNSIDRLNYSLAEEVGISTHALKKIDSIALKSIRDEEIPGCQILVAYQGSVIYNKSFGYHTYKKGRFVDNTDIYDLASITKVAATTASIMWLYDQRKLDIDHKLVWYLPFLYGTNKEYIIIREMMAHQAKLKPWIPFYQATLLDGKPDKRYYATKLDEKHTVKVADNLYIRNDYEFTLFDTIIHSDLRKRNGYKYSDLGFYLLKQAIENLTNKPLDKFVEETFYRSLGMQHTMYNPLGRVKKQKIVPTENDTYFRHQLIHGYVHDPGAAMLGGVAGHAGLFSNANDMAIFMQMLLNKGVYGGIRYLRASTVNQFTKQQFPLEENRRGIGFDKPDPQDPENGPTCEEASLLSFGHTGFTGTYAWADPKHDLIYIFLSNRIHPTARNTKLIRNNTRTEIQKVIYHALPEKKTVIAERDELGALPFAK